jgi:hypothetical protein
MADHDVAVQADRLARVARRVAVEGERAQAEIAGAIQFEQFRDLVLRQRLGREQVQGLGLALHRAGDHGQRVAQALARSRRRHDHDVLAVAHRVPGLGLVAVQALDAAGLQRAGQ